MCLYFPGSFRLCLTLQVRIIGLVSYGSALRSKLAFSFLLLVPYLCGVTRDNWLHVQQFVSEETIVVDLDRNNVMFGEKTESLPSVPGKKWLKLQDSLEDVAGHLFWRDPSLGMVGLYADFGELSPIHYGRLGIEGSYYSEDWSIDALIGFEYGQNVPRLHPAPLFLDGYSSSLIRKSSLTDDKDFDWSNLYDKLY